MEIRAEILQKAVWWNPTTGFMNWVYLLMASLLSCPSRYKPPACQGHDQARNAVLSSQED